MKNLQEEFPEKFGSSRRREHNENAVEGIQFMLNEETQDFDYLCSAIGQQEEPSQEFLNLQKNIKSVRFQSSER